MKTWKKAIFGIVESYIMNSIINLRTKHNCQSFELSTKFMSTKRNNQKRWITKDNGYLKSTFFTTIVIQQKILLIQCPSNLQSNSVEFHTCIVNFWGFKNFGTVGSSFFKTTSEIDVIRENINMCIFLELPLYEQHKNRIVCSKHQVCSGQV